MAEKYSDIIELRQQKAAYIIDNNDNKDWDCFIPTRLFNKMLETVVSSVKNTDVNLHKAFWITGSYGTGKSHAASVLKHILCDKIENITDFLDSQYAQNVTLKDDILKLRQQKTLFPITLCGIMDIASEADLAPVLQKEIYTTLKNAGIEVLVETDYKKYSDHIAADPQFWQSYVIDKNEELRAYASDVQTLKEKLDSFDTAVFALVRKTLSQSHIDIKITNSNISKWIFEVQDEVRKRGYNGLLIIWDEFTTLINNTAFGSSILNSLQKIAEIMQRSENDSYFLLISHPSVFDSLRSQEEKQQTQGRYHTFNYTMETVSAYKIMSGKFRRKTQEDCFGSFFRQNEDLYRHFSGGSLLKEDVVLDMQNLFPIHPYTAFLATYYAREAGSHSRSVFQFIGENPQIRQFLNNTEKFAALETVTADYLWDYVVGEFQEKTEKYGAVVQRYNLHINQIEQLGAEYPTVFKAVLLLNALNNIGNGDDPLLVPSEDNVRLVFKGTKIESGVDNVLTYFNDNNIIARTPDGLYSIIFTALPSQEIEAEKQKLSSSSSDFKSTEKVIKYADTVRTIFTQQLKPVRRPYTINFYSSDGEFTLRNRIKNEAKKAKEWDIVIAAFFARNNQELAELQEFAAKFSEEKQFQNILFTVFGTVLTDKDYNRFIEYQAQANVAHRHSHNEQEEDGKKNSLKIVENWINRAVKSGEFDYFIYGYQSGNNSGSVLARFINTTIAPSVVFTSGPESLDELKDRPDTFWEKKNAKSTSDKILLSTSKSEALEKLGPAQPLVAFFQESVDENLDLVPQCADSHPLKKVYKFIENRLDKTGRNEEFNLADILDDLRRPPFGLYPSYAAFAAVSVALRRYADKVFNPQGMPQSAKNISEKVSDLFRYWDENKGYDKLTLRFETEESISLCNLLIELFNFDKSKVQSLKQVRWEINEGKPSGLPLWVLKYVFDKNEKCFDDLTVIVDGILNICKNVDHQDQNVIENTLEKLKFRRYEFTNYLNSPESFQNGYVNFLKSVKLVDLQDEEIPAATEYIKKNLQGKKGLWTEDEVSEALTDWRLSTKPKEQPPVVQQPPQQPVIQQPPIAAEPTNNSMQKRDTARQKIRSHTNIDTLKKLLEKIIEKTGDESIIDDIINQL